MTTSRLTRRLLLLSGGVLVVLVVAVGWQSYQVATSLTRVVQDAADARGAIEAGDDIDAQLAELQASSRAASDHVHDWRWSLVTHVPWVGDDARGVRVAADTVADLSEEIAPAAEASAELTRLLPQEGRIDLEAVRELQAPVDAAAVALAAADEQLVAVDSTGYLAPLRTRFQDLQSQVGDAAHGLDSASIAVGLLPDLLGAEGPRNYLMVFQNNAEIRATGGLPGTLSIISTDDGKLDLGRQVATNTFGERERPVLPLSKDEREVFTNYLGVFALDASFTPDWPRASDLLRAHYEEKYPERLDGTVTLDTVAVSYLLEATGPVEVGGYTLTADNAVDVLLNQVYLDIADPRAQDALFQAVASTMFDRIASGDVGRPRDLLTALARATDEGRVSMHLFDDEMQAAVADRAIAGQTTGVDGRSDALTVAMNDGTAAKMSYYLEYEVRGRATSCVGGQEQVTVRATLRSTAPMDAGTALPPYVAGSGGNGIPPGDQIVETRLFTPSDGEVTDFRINGKEFDVKERHLVDRFVSTAYVYLEPGQAVDVEWQVSTPATGDVLPLDVTPGITPEQESSLVPAAC